MLYHAAGAGHAFLNHIYTSRVYTSGEKQELVRRCGMLGGVSHKDTYMEENSPFLFFLVLGILNSGAPDH